MSRDLTADDLGHLFGEVAEAIERDRDRLCALDGVIGDGKSLLFGQPVLQASYDLAGAPQGERDCVPKDFSSCHGGLEHI